MIILPDNSGLLQTSRSGLKRESCRRHFFVQLLQNGGYLGQAGWGWDPAPRPGL